MNVNHPFLLRRTILPNIEITLFLNSLTDHALDEAIASRFHADQGTVLFATLSPTADSHRRLQTRIFGSKIVEGQKIALVDVQIRIQDEHLPSHVAHTDERVNDVGAQVAGNIGHPVTADTLSIDRPVAEVTRYPGRLVC